MNLILGDCLEIIAGMEADSVDAIITDPPYGLGFMGKKWDAMPPGDEVAAAMLRVLKPAHYLLAFGGTRTHHRLMVALENAGFEIRDCLMWLYGSGFPKGKGQLKPAYEPIILCRKPGKGVRALGIDECRIGTGEDKGEWPITKRRHADVTWTVAPVLTDLSVGRWPANIVIDEEAGALIDEQSGVSGSRGGRIRSGATGRSGIYGVDARVEVGDPGYGDSGGASRFYYCAKASRSERNAGCEGLEERVYRTGCGGDMPVDDQGRDRDRFKSVARNHHPTVKPVALMRWLVRLITPPEGIVLDPFMGSGTTGVAAVQEGRFFVGIELDPEYHHIAEARIAHAEERQLEMVS